MGTFQKKCKGCGAEFTSEGRGARFAPPEVCNCLAKRAKTRNKRARERRAYARDPETHKALSKTRAEARKMVLAAHGITIKSDGRVILDGTGYLKLGCNSPGCKHNFARYYQEELEQRAREVTGSRGARQMTARLLLKKLEAHHRDHNPFNNRIENYPQGSNIELLCRNHHEQADRAKAGKAQIEIWKPQPRQTMVNFLLRLRRDDPRTFFLVRVSELMIRWQKETV